MVRVMPNIPALVQQGASAFALGNHANSRDRDIVMELMSAVGYVEEVQEKDVAAVTGLSGSGPAYVSDTDSYYVHIVKVMFIILVLLIVLHGN